MVTQRGIDRYMGQVEEIAKNANVNEKDVKRVLEVIGADLDSRRRKPRQEPPDGCISIREAGRKYHIPHTTISYWARKGYVTIKERFANWLYIDESSLIEYIRNSGHV